MLMSFLQPNQSQEQNQTCLKLSGAGGEGGEAGSGGGGQGGEKTQTMYAHVNK
jgi:hypothetical protein